ncbi:MAG: regulatory protein GemA [Sulfuricaulis sp.]|nr:regulatory protein GemA [Sulfuricaulis sp.]
MPLSRKKISLIHIAKSRLGLTDEEYRKLLEASGGVRSSADLNDAGFAELMRCFKRLGFESDAAHKAYGDRPGMATPAQVILVRKLWEQHTGSCDESALGHWLLHYFGVSSLRFADHEVVSKALTALKNMVERRHKDEHS